MSHWHTRWMELANLVATWSKDRSRQIGAVIVDPRNVVVALGWNGFPRGVNDDVDERHARPAKHKYTVHAEANALLNSAAKGVSTLGCTIYTILFPCAPCAMAIIQAGITQVVTYEPDWNDGTYAADFAASREMFEESGVSVLFVAGISPTRKPDPCSNSHPC